MSLSPHARRTRFLLSVFGAAVTIGAAFVTMLLWRLRVAPRRESPRRVRVTDSAEEPRSAADGTGALMHRTYSVAIPAAGIERAALFGIIQRNLIELSPSALANFEKQQGSEHRMAIGDEYEVTMLGPWNGCVRVMELDEQAFTLRTLEGHPEVGQITFSVHDHATQTETLVVRIESWARARDVLVKTAYDTLGVGMQVQTEVWVTFLQRAAALAGVDETPEVAITTEELVGADDE